MESIISTSKQKKKFQAPNFQQFDGETDLEDDL